MIQLDHRVVVLDLCTKHRTVISKRTMIHSMTTNHSVGWLVVGYFISLLLWQLARVVFARLFSYCLCMIVKLT